MSTDFIEVRRLLNEIKVASLSNQGIFHTEQNKEKIKEKPPTFDDGTEASAQHILTEIKEAPKSKPATTGIKNRPVRQAYPLPSSFWPSMTVAYSFQFTDDAWQNLIRSALRHIESQTCIRFTESNRTQDYLQYIRGSGCWSSVGRTGGRQQVSVGYGCDAMGIVAHETLHALGLWHEQSRSDRDSYITVDFQRISAGTQSNFEKRTATTSDNLDQPYDLGSVMHYGSKAFSTDYNRLQDRHEKNVENLKNFAQDLKTCTSTGIEKCAATKSGTGQCLTWLLHSVNLFH
uniref:Metalloendopeptidase n=1 Tax=Ditylenchus dipsaci TaxID=166011 RepID=A0A915DE51_9BILA